MKQTLYCQPRLPAYTLYTLHRTNTNNQVLCGSLATSAAYKSHHDHFIKKEIIFSVSEEWAPIRIRFFIVTIYSPQKRWGVVRAGRRAGRADTVLSNLARSQSKN